MMGLAGGGRLRRAVLRLGAAGAAAGALLLVPAAAQAVTGTQPGKLSLRPASGAASVTPTWSTTTGCPAGFQASAVLYALNSDGSIGSSISATVDGVTSAFSGKLLGPVGQVFSLGTDVRRGGTSRWVVACSSGPGGTGRRAYVQSDTVTLSADGTSYTSAVAGDSGPAGARAPLIAVALVIVLAGGGLGGWQAARWQRRRGDIAAAAAATARPRARQPAAQPRDRE